MIEHNLKKQFVHRQEARVGAVQGEKTSEKNLETHQDPMPEPGSLPVNGANQEVGAVQRPSEVGHTYNFEIEP